jgi:hypothetical protein
VFYNEEWIGKPQAIVPVRTPAGDLVEVILTSESLQSDAPLRLLSFNGERPQCSRGIRVVSSTLLAPSQVFPSTEFAGLASLATRSKELRQIVAGWPRRRERALRVDIGVEQFECRMWAHESRSAD